MKGHVARIVDNKGFGFVKAGNDAEYFFHKSDFNGFWEDLVEDCKSNRDIPVTFDPGSTPKGLRAVNVRRTDHPNESN